MIVVQRLRVPCLRRLRRQLLRRCDRHTAYLLQPIGYHHLGLRDALDTGNSAPRCLLLRSAERRALNGNRRRAAEHDTPEGSQKARSVAHGDTHTVPAADAHRLQICRRFFGVFPQLTIGHLNTILWFGQTNQRSFLPRALSQQQISGKANRTRRCRFASSQHHGLALAHSFSPPT